MTEFKGIALSVLCLGIFVSSCSDSEQAGFTESDWAAYGGQNNGNRYSTLTQVNRDNVSRLKPAWQFDMDDPGASQTQPIVVGGVVPPQDFEALYEAGAAAIYPPGTVIVDAAAELLDKLG